MNDAERLTRLEERYAHLQRHSIEQDKVMLGLSEQLAKVRQEMQALRAQAVGGAGAGQPEEPVDERPPHY